jgi:hypothetical protein
MKNVYCNADTPLCPNARLGQFGDVQKSARTDMFHCIIILYLGLMFLRLLDDVGRLVAFA